MELLQSFRGKKYGGKNINKKCSLLDHEVSELSDDEENFCVYTWNCHKAFASEKWGEKSKKVVFYWPTVR